MIAHMQGPLFSLGVAIIRRMSFVFSPDRFAPDKAVADRRPDRAPIGLHRRWQSLYEAHAHWFPLGMAVPNNLLIP